MPAGASQQDGLQHHGVPSQIPLGSGQQEALAAILANAGLAADGVPHEAAPEPEDMDDDVEGDASDDSEGASRPAKVQDYKCKPRRKATQKPVVSAIRACSICTLVHAAMAQPV